MNNIPNRQVICDILLEHAKEDRDIVVLCSDSRGSASMAPFFTAFPEQSVEVGIAEQNLVSISAGMAKAGKKPFCFSPASFISTRSYEQCKVDCAYSDQNVKLIGISGGISYGALGMTHHSAQDFAAMQAIPNMRVYCPSDRFQTGRLVEALLKDDKPAYVRVGRNPVEDIYREDDVPFTMDKANVIGNGDDVLIVATGEMVCPAVEAMTLLKNAGINATVLDMYCIKPFDKETFIEKAKRVRLVVTVEEHAPFGGMGATAAVVLGENCPGRFRQLALPDTAVITGTSKEVFEYYGLTGEGICRTIMDELNKP